MEDTRNAELTFENKPNSSDIQFLEERIIEFNVEATGITDGELFGVFLRGTDGRSSEGLMAGHGAGLATFATFSFPRRCGSKATAQGLWLGSRKRLKRAGVSKLCSKPTTSRHLVVTASSVSG